MNNIKRRIGIIGNGRIGKPLSQHFTDNGHFVIMNNNGNIKQLVENSEVIVIAVPKNREKRVISKMVEVNIGNKIILSTTLGSSIYDSGLTKDNQVIKINPSVNLASGGTIVWGNNKGKSILNVMESLFKGNYLLSCTEQELFFIRVANNVVLQHCRTSIIQHHKLLKKEYGEKHNDVILAAWLTALWNKQYPFNRISYERLMGKNTNEDIFDTTFNVSSYEYLDTMCQYNLEQYDKSLQYYPLTGKIRELIIIQNWNAACRCIVRNDFNKSVRGISDIVKTSSIDINETYWKSY